MTSVLCLHNRYRVTGGEERSLELQLEAFRRAGIEHGVLERDSAATGRTAAATALLRGGADPEEVGALVRELGADVVHVHNMLPLLGVRALHAAREAGAQVVMTLHNVRLFCATGFGERGGGPCGLCRGRDTRPGLRHACRGSVPEAAVYAAALSAHQPGVVEAVDRFLCPSQFATGEVVARGLPETKVSTHRHYLPDEAFATSSAAGDGAYVLVVSRLSQEKGIGDAIAAARAAGAPLKVAGDGPDAEALRAEAGAGVEFLGRVDPARVRELLRGAAAVVMPSRYHEFAPYSALEAMAQGVPVVATAMGGLPDLLGEGRCVPAGHLDALTDRLARLWSDPAARQAEGEELLARARDRHGERRWLDELLAVYAAL